MAMYGFNDLILFIGTDPDAFERFSGAAVGTDKSFVVCSRKCGRFAVRQVVAVNGIAAVSLGVLYVSPRISGAR